MVTMPTEVTGPGRVEERPDVRSFWLQLAAVLG